METIIIVGLILSSLAMVFIKRINSLIVLFALQSLFLFGFSMLEALRTAQVRLFIISGLILILKAILIPFILRYIVKTIQADEDLGSVINNWLSLVVAVLLIYLSWSFSSQVFARQETLLVVYGTTSFTMIFIGMFIMIFKMKALAQIIGLLAMENGIFLFASAISGGMPFLVEMAIFFDVFVAVLILGIFVFRINRLFVGIDISKLNRLQG